MSRAAFYMPANLARCRRAWRMAPPRQGVGLFLRNFHVWLIGPRVFLKGRFHRFRRTKRENGFENDTRRFARVYTLIAPFTPVLSSYRDTLLLHRRNVKDLDEASEVNGEKGAKILVSSRWAFYRVSFIVLGYWSCEESCVANFFSRYYYLSSLSEI